MSKAGQKIVDAARELLDAVKCDHIWRGDRMHVEQGKLISVTARCEKCGMRQTTYSR